MWYGLYYASPLGKNKDSLFIGFLTTQPGGLLFSLKFTSVVPVNKLSPRSQQWPKVKL